MVFVEQNSKVKHIFYLFFPHIYSMFFRIHAFQGPGFLGCRFFRVQVQVLVVAFLRTPFLQNTSGELLLQLIKCLWNCSSSRPYLVVSVFPVFCFIKFQWLIHTFFCYWNFWTQLVLKLVLNFAIKLKYRKKKSIWLQRWDTIKVKLLAGSSTIAEVQNINISPKIITL